MLKIFICITAFLFFFSSSAHPETIQLKSGRTIEGEIVERGADYIRLDLRGVVLTYYLDEIETIDGRPSAEEKESLSTSPASPHTPRLDRAELKKRIGTQLRELHYPEHTHPALKEELIAFFERIDFQSLQEEARLADSDPEKLKALAKKIRGIFQGEGFLDPASPQPLIRLLVDSFGDDDILKVIEASPLSRQKKKESKWEMFACSAISQLGGVLLDLLGLSVKTLNSGNFMLKSGHVANYILLKNQEMFLFDLSIGRFEIIDLEYWYQKEGKGLVLKPRHRLSIEKIFEMIRERQQGIQPISIKELLNHNFLYIDLTDHYSASGAIYYNRGNSYHGKGKLKQAIISYNHSLRINPDFYIVYNNRGFVYYQKGELNQAIADYNQSLFINPNFALAYDNRGVAYSKKGNLNQAIADYNKALGINPYLANIYNNRAVAYFFKDNYTRAWEDVRRAQELGYPVPQELISELRRASGQER